jgi:hypothetical protein
MDLDTVTCRVRVQLPNLTANKLSLILFDDIYISTDTRRQWAEHLMKTFDPTHNPSRNIRPLDIILFPDGNIEAQSLPTQKNIDNKTPTHEDKTDDAVLYPAPYRIPPYTIANLDHDDRILREECFALGSLLYELFNNSPPFADLPDETIQQRFSAAEFPKNVLDFPKWPIILSCWSLEFAAELRRMCQYTHMRTPLPAWTIANTLYSPHTIPSTGTVYTFAPLRLPC